MSDPLPTLTPPPRARFQFHYTPAHANEAQRLSISTGPFIFRYHYWIVVVIPGTLACLLLLTAQWANPALYLLFLTAVLNYLPTWRQNRAYECYLTSKLEPYVIECSSEFITLIAPEVHHKYLWQSLHRITEGRTVLLLHFAVSNTLILVVPKSAFPTPADLDAFRILCQSKVHTHAFPVQLNPPG